MATIVDIGSVITTLITQAPLVAIVILVLIIYFNRGLKNIENMLKDLEDRFDDKLDRGLKNLAEILLEIMVRKGVVGVDDYDMLKSILSRTSIVPRSKYYTKEDHNKLMELLKKDPSEITWDDIKELERIYGLMVKEAKKSGWKDLEEYAFKLMILIGIAKGLLRKREERSSK